MNDFRFAFRQLAKAPGFTAVAVLTLALGIGLSTTIFNGVNPLLFRSLPFRDIETLVDLDETSPKQGFNRLGVAYADFVHWRKENRVFAAIDAWDTTNLVLTGQDQPERIEGCRVSASLFRTLGIQPARGRDFLPDEDRPDAGAVVILGDHLWERLFNRSEEAIGQSLILNGKAHTVVGVMPQEVRFPYDSDVWIPLVVLQPEKTHGSFSCAAVGRLKPGVTIEQALADLTAIHARIAQESPQSNLHIGPVIRPIEEAFIESELRTMGWMMLGSVVFVLAVACANVASLFLTRALSRQKEFAVRAALGSGRWRTIRQLLVESLLLGGIGGALGLVISVWGLDIVLSLVPVRIPYWLDFTMDWRVFAFAAGVSILTSVLFGLAPALQASRVNVLECLNDATRGSSGGRQRHRLRSALVVAEVAVASLLLCGTGLMIRSLINLQRVNPGFNAANVSVFYLDLTTSMHSDQEARSAFFTTFLERLRSIPGVSASTACSNLPLSGRNTGQAFTVEGQPPPPSGVNHIGNLRVITPGYFAAMQIPLLAGRDFTTADNTSSGKVIIIDAALARQHFGSTNPIGQRIRWDRDDPQSSREIVGVAADVKHSSLDGLSRPGFYTPYAQSRRVSMGIMVRTTAEKQPGLLASIQQQLRSLDPTLPLYRAQTMEDTIRETFWIRRFLGRLLVGFAALALGLAAVGIASVVGYAVTHRQQEIGIRMALGAQPGSVVRMMLADGMVLVFTGLCLGLLGSIVLARVLSSQLYGVGAIDPLSLVASGTLFAAIAAFACWLPARRATQVNPVTALRAE